MDKVQIPSNSEFQEVCSYQPKPADLYVAERRAVLYARPRPISFRQLIEIRCDTSTLAHRTIPTKIYDVSDTQEGITYAWLNLHCQVKAVSIHMDGINHTIDGSEPGVITGIRREMAGTSAEIFSLSNQELRYLLRWIALIRSILKHSVIYVIKFQTLHIVIKFYTFLEDRLIRFPFHSEQIDTFLWNLVVWRH
jgi:hypothetical protein